MLICPNKTKYFIIEKLIYRNNLTHSIEGMDIEGIEGRIKEYHNAKLESGSSIEISSTLKVKLVPKD